MGVPCICLVGAFHGHYVMRSIPLYGVKVLYLAQLIKLDHRLWETAKKEKKGTPVA